MFSLTFFLSRGHRAILALVWLALTACATGQGQAGDASGADTQAEPVEVSGCGGAALLKVGAPEQPGPWPVGARTVDIDGLTVEVLYPAKLGSAENQPRRTYDLRSWLPEGDKDKIPDDQAPVQTCECYTDLPVDDQRGPYPVVVFIHGTAAFRTQSIGQLAHWASRGFIVLAADHPKIYLKDALALNLGADQVGDAKKLFDALKTADPALAFLEGTADTAHMAASGHSAGGNACAKLGDVEGVRVLIPMAAGGVDPKLPVESSLVLAGDGDKTVPVKNTVEGYEQMSGRKRLVVLKGAGHLAFSQLCDIAGDDGDLYALALKWKISIPPGTGPLFEQLATDGCDEGQLKGTEAERIINLVTTAVLEETLRCQDGPDPLEGVAAEEPLVAEYRAALGP